MKSKYNKIQQIITNLKQPEYRYVQITDAIFKKRIGEFKRMVSLRLPLLRDRYNWAEKKSYG